MAGHLHRHCQVESKGEQRETVKAVISYTYLNLADNPCERDSVQRLAVIVFDLKADACDC
jgi:hypothetical protein